jgi:hypothetical protein
MVTLIALLLTAAPAPKVAPKANLYMHKSTKDAILLGCLKDGQDIHCFELGGFLDELGYRAVEKEEAAPKKEAAPEPKKNEL